MRCTVDGLTPNRSAMTRMPGRRIARASAIRFSSGGAIGGRPRRFPSLLALASPARSTFRGRRPRTGLVGATGYPRYPMRADRQARCKHNFCPARSSLSRRRPSCGRACGRWRSPSPGSAETVAVVASAWVNSSNSFAAAPPSSRNPRIGHGKLDPVAAIGHSARLPDLALLNLQALLNRLSRISPAAAAGQPSEYRSSCASKSSGSCSAQRVGARCL